ncbi:C-type lectin domain family 1 member A-like [Emys orbicularis]|uniref:C-type lectin domain family 1 member A-like n=1 Tax=Emys orbicularis TaxID=82168 RepID=UPI0031FD900A
MEDEDGYTILNFRSRNPAFIHEPSGTNKGITQPNAPDVPSESIPLPSKWRCTALIWGILCLTLLVTAGILGIQVTQASHLASASLKNLSQQLELLQAKNANLSEILQLLTRDRGQKYSLCPENWFWYGEVCYHLSTEWKTWQGSKDYCSSHDSRLLKIENKEELDFIVSLSCRLWIGLSRNAVNRTWVWEDGAALPTDLFQVSEIYYEGDCVILEDGKAQSYGCIFHNRCVCKKKSA